MGEHCCPGEGWQDWQTAARARLETPSGHLAASVLWTPLLGKTPAESQASLQAMPRHTGELQEPLHARPCCGRERRDEDWEPRVRLRSRIGGDEEGARLYQDGDHWPQRIRRKTGSEQGDHGAVPLLLRQEHSKLPSPGVRPQGCPKGWAQEVKETELVQLESQDLLACCGGCGFGCPGQCRSRGYAQRAESWTIITQKGTCGKEDGGGGEPGEVV